jgi:uncharacterized protein (TIGR00369 family)
MEAIMAKWGMDFVNSIREEKFPTPPFAAHLRLRQDVRFETVEEGRVVQIWTVAPHFTLPDGIIQGGLLCSVADMSQTMALMTTHDAFETWPTLDFHTRFVRPMKAGDVVRIESKVVNKSKNTALIETTFTSVDDKLLARVSGGWVKAERQRDSLPKADKI